MSSLAQFLMLGQQSVGSLALSRDQSDLFVMAVNSIADIISDVFTHSEVNRVLVLNGFDPQGVKLEHSTAGDTDMTAVADFLQKVGASFLSWRPEDEAWLRGIAHMPEVDVEELQAEADAKQARSDAIQANIAKAQAAQQTQGQQPGGPPAETPNPDGMPSSSRPAGAKMSGYPPIEYSAIDRLAVELSRANDLLEFAHE